MVGFKAEAKTGLIELILREVRLYRVTPVSNMRVTVVLMRTLLNFKRSLYKVL